MEGETFGQRIKKRRIELGMSTQDIADRLDVARTTVYGWESDRYLPAMEHFRRLRDVLSISLDELFGVSDGEMVISENEKRLIRAYRNMPEMQESVHRLLRIELDEKSE